ncbi:MAG TPA: FtsX-like permease family protein, partial [Micromonosporaceae bacterium]
PADPYWGPATLAAQFQSQVERGLYALDAMFVTMPTMVASNSSDASVDRTLIIQPQALSVRAGLDIDDRIADAATRLQPDGYAMTENFPALVDRIVYGTNQVFTSVSLGALEVLLFGWFALFLAIRATAAARRFDIGILKLRGVQRGKLWRLMTEQSLVPLLAGAPIGAIVGFIAAHEVGGAVRAPDDIRLAAAIGAGGVIVTVLGGLVAALLAERAALASPVGDLLRGVPGGRRGWRADVADLLMVVLAIAAVVQIRTAASGEAATLGIVAPGLLAFAIGLVTARLLAPLSMRAVAAARRRGRIRTLLTSTYLARRPGLDRIFALCTIAVALAGYAFFATGTASAARSARARLEIGAASVLTLSSVTPLDLIRAVDAADPSGRYAMAATQITDGAGTHILAVDSSRLAAVLPPGSVGNGVGLATALRPTPSHEVRVTGRVLQLDVDDAVVPSTTYAIAWLMGSAGPLVATFGPLGPGARTYTAPTAECSSERRCELIGFSLSTRRNPTSPLANASPPGTSVRLTELRQLVPDGEVLAATAMGSAPRWRTTIETDDIGPVLSASSSGLSMVEPPTGYVPGTSVDSTAYVNTVPVPLPVVVAGTAPAATAPGVFTVSPFGFGDVPIQVVRSVPVLPRLGSQGVLVDLDYAQALAGPDTAGATSEVWLAAGAPAGVTDTLRREGLVVIDRQGIGDRAATYAEEPDVVGLRFEVVAGLVAVAIAAVALLLVGSVERRGRASELVALRRQGMSGRVMRTVVVCTYVVLAGGAALAGLIGAVLVRLVSAQPPIFADGWHVLARPSAIGLSSLLITVAVAIVALGSAAAVAGYQLGRAADRQFGAPSSARGAPARRSERTEGR